MGGLLLSHIFPHSLLAVAFSLLLHVTRAGAEIGVALQMQLGNPSNALADAANHRHCLIQRTVEAIDYDDILGEPNWVSWDLTASDVGSSGRSPTFITDTTLPAGFYGVTTGDYINSGFNRGHLCPSADRTNTDANNTLVFFLSNILPQMADNNQGPWASFEAYCRTLAAVGDELMIIAGGSGYTGASIPSGKAGIPGYTWKIAVVISPGSGTAVSRINASTRVIALKIPNVSGIRSSPWAHYVTTPNQIQADTGYTFFTALSAETAATLRTKFDGGSAAVIAGLSPASGGTNTAVVITGSGFTSAASVSFNGTFASFTVNSDTQIATMVPAGASSGPIRVDAPGGIANSPNVFTVLPAPSIAGFVPASGNANSLVVLSGAGFNTASRVTFNGTAASFTIDSDAQITATLPPGATSGAVAVLTPNGLATTSSNFLVMNANPGRPVISQIYGSGGNSGAIYKHDFIEIYNAGTGSVDLSTYAVQYASATGTTWQETLLSGLLLPGHYCLIQEAQGIGGTQNLPTPQIIGTISMSGTSGKVALTNTPALLTGGNPLSNPAVVDFVGYGTADVHEGALSAPLLTNTTSARRTDAGGIDTNSNGADFSASIPTPNNTSAFDAWMSRTFTAAELRVISISGALASPSSDRVSNLAKYAFNLDPHKADGPSAFSYSTEVSGSGRILTLSHRKNHYAVDVTFTYEVSFDLVTWTALPAPSTDVASVDAKTDMVSVSVAAPAPAFFIRLRTSL